MPWVPLQPWLKSHIPQIQEDLKTHAISVYPQEDFDQDPDDRVLNDLIRVSARMLGLGMLLSWGGPSSTLGQAHPSVLAGEDPLCCGGGGPGAPGEWQAGAGPQDQVGYH